MSVKSATESIEPTNHLTQHSTLTELSATIAAREALHAIIPTSGGAAE